MKSPPRLVVAAAAFLLGCGLVALLENDSAELADLARRHEATQAEYERMARELRQVRDEKRALAAQLDAEMTDGRGELAAAGREPLQSADPSGSTGEPVRGVGADAGSNPILEAVAEYLGNGDLDNATHTLEGSFESGDLTKLELMNAAVAHPELISAGINNHDLADRFREVLIDSLSSTDDPIGVLRDVDLKGEPNQSFSSKIATMVRAIVDKNTEADERIFTQVQDLLAGNPMRGEKINLYPTLAQLGSQGHEPSRAAAQQFVRESGSMFAKGVSTLLEPPSYDHLGRKLRGAGHLQLTVQQGGLGEPPEDTVHR